MSFFDDLILEWSDDLMIWFENLKIWKFEDLRRLKKLFQVVIVDIFSWFSIKSALICEICGNGKKDNLMIWKFESRRWMSWSAKFENSKIYPPWKDYSCDPCWYFFLDFQLNLRWSARSAGTGKKTIWKFESRRWMSWSAKFENSEIYAGWKSLSSWLL